MCEMAFIFSSILAIIRRLGKRKCLLYPVVILNFFSLAVIFVMASTQFWLNPCEWPFLLSLGVLVTGDYYLSKFYSEIRKFRCCI